MNRAAYHKFLCFLKSRFPQTFVFFKNSSRWCPPLYWLLKRLKCSDTVKFEPPHCMILPHAGAEFDLPPVKEALNNILICTTPRSGSSLLSNLMSESGLMGKPKEYFGNNDLMSQMMYRLKSKNIVEYVKGVQACRTTANGVFSAKLMFDQWEQAFGTEPLESFFEKIKYIRLLRRDAVAQAVSMTKADASGVWSTPFTEIPNDYLIKTAPEINEEFIRGSFAYLHSCNLGWEKYFNKNSKREVLTLYYEDFCV